ncbi:MAG: peptide ABC transporter permease [Actinobacteria bacterium]|nr:peptide ABC transporter permease [Actinomycetota bacterium]|tara:strand:+ start:1422 stop:2357 length:936 start_codon:yes stop_codon:yes gene_type:complete
MLTYVIKRILWVPLVMLVIAFIVFVLGIYGPGDPIEVMLGNNYTEELANSLREKKGLNDPVFIQYARYVTNSLKGDFGESYKYPGKSVSELLAPKLVVSGKLFLISIFISTFIGIPLGFYSAIKQGTIFDPLVVSFTLVVYAMPVFLTAPLLIIIFALNLGWVPVSGWGGFWDVRVVLPAITIGLPGVAVITRLMRASTLDVLGQEFITFAKAKGVSYRDVIIKHVGKNAIIPVVTVLGLSFSGLLGGALIVELIFGIPGVARFALDAIFSRDYPIIMALTLIGTASLVVANLIVDLLYVLLDPRIRYSND